MRFFSQLSPKLLLYPPSLFYYLIVSIKLTKIYRIAVTQYLSIIIIFFKIARILRDNMKFIPGSVMILLLIFIVGCMQSQPMENNKKLNINNVRRSKGLKNQGQISTRNQLNQVEMKYKNLLLKYYSNSSLLGEIGVRSTDFWTSKYVSTLLNQNQKTGESTSSTQLLIKLNLSNVEVSSQIQKGNYSSIINIVDKISADTSTNEQAKLKSLLKIYSTIKQAIETKLIISNYFQVVIKSAQEEIDWLNSSIKRLQNQRQKANMKNKNAIIKDLQIRLKNYEQIDKIMNSSINKNMMEIPKYQQQIAKIQAQNKQQVDKINSNKQFITKKDEQIKQIQRQIEEANKIKKSIENNISSTENQIKENQVKIQMFRNLIAQSDELVKYTRLMEDSAKKQTRVIEVFLERVRQDWSDANAQSRNNLDKLQEIDSQVSFLKHKVFYSDQLNNIKDSIKNLNFILPYIEENLKNETEKFVSVVQQQGLGSISSLERAKILDEVSKDYSCLFDSSNFSFTRGTIKKVQKDFFQIVDEKENMIKLRIGKCSKIASSSSIPLLEQSILWKGFLIKQDQKQYNLFNAIVF